MKKTLTVSVVVIFILVITFILFDKTTDRSKTTGFVGDILYVTNFTYEGKSTGKALLRVPFLKTDTDAEKITISIDIDGDTAFSENEVFVNKFPVRPRANWKSGYYTSGNMVFTDSLDVKITLDDSEYFAQTEVSTINIGALFDLSSVTEPESSMKGWGVRTVFANDTLEIFQEEVPDLNQQPGECAPTTAANSLISLIGKNGSPADIPGTPEQMIDELKEDMKWNLQNGVEPDNFVSGKNEWARRHGLPITTKKVGDVHGLNTLGEVREALQNQSAVEMRIKFAETGSNKIAGGHMITVVGIHEGEGQTYLDINDPATPEGTETVEIRGNQITNYAPWSGITVMSWAFVQSWQLDNTYEPTTGVRNTEDPLVVDMAFEHVAPGQYSEVYATIITTPGDEVTATLEGPSVDFKGSQTVVADENGQVHFTWKIYSFGEYTVTGTDQWGSGFVGNIIVN